MLLRPLFPVLFGLLLLVACSSADERAEEHYQRGLELIAEGDYDRAVVELRNVFRLNGSHREARLALGNLLLKDLNRPRAAYGEFLRLAEQFPDDVDARVTLAGIAFRFSEWPEMERHGTAAINLAPERPDVQVLNVLLDYRTAVLNEDEADRRDQARRAEELLSNSPDDIQLRRLLLDNRVRNGERVEALADLDWLLEQDPNDQRFWRQRIALLAEMNDFEAVEAQLRDMVVRFADDDTHKATLIRFYLARQQNDKAEAFLRDLILKDDTAGRRLDLIQFLMRTKGEDSAREAINVAITDHPEEPRFPVMLASLDFQAGEISKAISAIENVVEGAEPSETILGIKVTLARMLAATGNEVGAQARIEEVLANDPENTEALKVKSIWQIRADDTDAAIAGLRIALEKSPEDANAMQLMAEAYIRAGRPELARDFLALAVDASGNAPEETVRYAQVLISEERYLPAEDILLPALRLAPQNIDLLRTLGQLYLGMDDLGRAEQVSVALREIGSEAALQFANALDAERINQTSGVDDAMRFLEDIAGQESASNVTKVTLLRARLGTGDTEGALEIARKMAEETPNSPALQVILASVEAASGNLKTAEIIYRELLEASPESPRVWLELSRLMVRQGDREEATRVLQKGLEIAPSDVNLLWATASDYETRGKIDEAITIYEELYAQNSNLTVIANNLASLITTYRTSEEELERAWKIARRLRDSDVPAFQDTYGWITHRRGDHETALPYLEDAARNLPRDPLVQFHLAEVYAALDRPKDALNSYRLAVEIAGPADSRPQITRANEQIRLLEAESLAEPAADE